MSSNSKSVKQMYEEGKRNLFDAEKNLKTYLVVRICLELIKVEHKAFLESIGLNGRHFLSTGNRKYTHDIQMNVIQRLQSLQATYAEDAESAHDFERALELRNYKFTQLSVFGTKYKKVDDAYQSLINNQFAIHVSLPEQPDSFSNEPLIYDHSKSEMLLSEFINDERKLCVVSGHAMAGKSTLIRNFVKQLKLQEGNQHSIVYIDTARFNAIETALIELFDELYTRCKPFMSERSRARACRHKEKGMLYDALGELFKVRPNWLIFIDSFCSSTDERDQQFYNAIRETDFSFLISNISSLNVLSNLDIKVIAVTSEIKIDANEDAYEINIACDFNMNAFRDYVGTDLIPSHIVETMGADSVFQVMLLRNMVGMLEYESEFSKHALMSEGVKAIHAGEFKKWFYFNLLLRSETYNNSDAFATLCICALPEDNMYLSSLKIVLAMLFRHRFPALKNAGIQKKIKSHLEALSVFKGRYIHEEYDGNAVYYRVHPFVRRVILENWGESESGLSLTSEFGTKLVQETVSGLSESQTVKRQPLHQRTQQRFRKEAHFMCGIFAFSQYLKDNDNEPCSYEPQDTIVTNLSAKNRRLLQSVRNLLMAVDSQSSTNHKRHVNEKLPDFKIEYELLLNGVTTIHFPTNEDILNTAWVIMSQLLRNLRTINSTTVSYLKFNLLMEFVHAGKPRKAWQLFSDILPSPSRLLINGIQHHGVNVYMQLASQAMKLGKYQFAMQAFEQMWFALESGYLGSENDMLVTGTRKDIYNSYFHIALKTGQFEQAAFYLERSSKDTKPQLDRATRGLVKLTPNKKIDWYVHSYLNSQARAVMVSLSQCSYMKVLDCIDNICRYSRPIDITLSIQELKRKVAKQHKHLSQTHQKILLKVEVEHLINQVDIPIVDIETIDSDVLADEHVITIGQSIPEFSYMAVNEAIRALLRLKALANNELLSAETSAEIHHRYEGYMQILEGALESVSRKQIITNMRDEHLNLLVTKSALIRFTGTCDGHPDNIKPFSLKALEMMMLKLVWQAKLPMQQKLEFLLESLRIQLFYQPLYEPGGGDKLSPYPLNLTVGTAENTFLFTTINWVISHARRQDNPRLLSSALVLSWIYYIELPGEYDDKTKPIQDELEAIASQYRYEYRRPEIEMLKLRRNPLPYFPI